MTDKLNELIEKNKHLDGIRGFFLQNRFLSNFYSCFFEYDGVMFPAAENAYQAKKDWANAKTFAYISSSDAKRLGSRVIITYPDWDNNRLIIMEEVLRAKFNDYDLGKWLLETGDQYLEETNWWGDKFWGVCNGVGENNLGKLLMKIRSEL